MRIVPLILAMSLPASAAKLDYPTFALLHARLLEGASAEQLEDALPHLRRDIKTASAVSRRHWTDCTVFDELAKADILEEKALKALGIRRETTAGVAHAPAGLMHTYGYLFSQLQTAYGLKGKRWIESRLDERLGLPAGTFSPLTEKGEFTSNLTTVLLQLIGAPSGLAHAAKLTPSARPAGRVEQQVVWRTPAGKKVEATVFTVLVPLAALPDLKTSDDFLLVYGMHRGGRTLLTTAFPVAKDFAGTFMAAKPGRSTAFTPRFNLYIPLSWKVVSQESAGWRAD